MRPTRIREIIMKKYVNFLFVIVIILLVSCTENPHKEIKKAFKMYVQETFDNPKDLEEIVSISEEKVICIDSLMELSKSALKMYDDVAFKADSIDSVVTAKFDNVQKKDLRTLYYIQNNHSNKWVKLFIENFMGNLGLKLEHTDIIINRSRKKMLELLNDTTQQYNSFTTQTIKYRIKSGDTMLLDSVFYISKNGDIPYINSVNVQTKEIGGRIDDFNPFMQELTETAELNLKRIEMLYKAENALQIIQER